MSEYKYGYEKLMAENDLQMSDLTEDAKNSIMAIKDFEKSIKMAQGKGKDASETTLGKIRTSDKMAVQEIVDMLDEDNEDDNDDNNEDDNEFNSQNYNKEDSYNYKEPNETVVITDPKGLKIDSELDVAYSNGKKEIGFDELKSISKTAYDVIFDNYDNSGDNGVETSKFSLIETNENVFTLTKNRIMITKFETSGGSNKSSNTIIYLIGAVIIGYLGYKYVIKPEMDKRKAEQNK